MLEDDVDTQVKQKDTEDSSAGEEEDNRDKSTKLHRRNRHMIAFCAGICGMLVLAAVIGVVVGMVGSSSFLASSEAEGASEFDFPSSSVSSSSGTSPQPSEHPREQPSASPTDHPTDQPTDIPTMRPSSEPTIQAPTSEPSLRPSLAPTTTPSFLPSTSVIPTRVPSSAPTRMPNTYAPITPIDNASDTLLTFCVIADVPYIQRARNRLPGQIRDQIDGCEFLVHLGDIMQGDQSCNAGNYNLVRNMLLRSAIPTFVLLGDNEWNDCGNQRRIEAAWSRWEQRFMYFDTNWNHTFGVHRQPGYQENYYFIHKKTLIFGLNIVGGRVHDESEWFLRLTAEIDWVKSIVGIHVPRDAAGIIIMAHANPNANHSPFFDALKNFIRDDLGDQIPILYLHGDGHSYFYRNYFLDQPNALQIQHEGGVRDPVLKILSDPFHMGPAVEDSFQVDRQLHLK